jgi:molybdopterin molybdotransferase
MALLDAGTELTAAHLALIAAGGHGRVAAHMRPRVAVMTTGDELVPPGEPLGPAQIPDSNSIGLMTLARECGAETRSLGIAHDSLDDVVERLEQGLEWADVIVASGGVSVGAHDVVKEAFGRVGRIDLWRVAVQPGKPVAFGRARRADGGEALLFGLPGNPVSSQVTFELFVRPAVRRMAGHRDLIGREIVRARMSDRVTKAPGRRAFLRVRLVEDLHGWRAELAGGQESHMLRALAAADGLAIVPEAADSIEQGAEIQVIRLR